MQRLLSIFQLALFSVFLVASSGCGPGGPPLSPCQDCLKRASKQRARDNSACWQDYYQHLSYAQLQNCQQQAYEDYLDRRQVCCQTFGGSCCPVSSSGASSPLGPGFFSAMLANLVPPFVNESKVFFGVDLGQGADPLNVIQGAVVKLKVRQVKNGAPESLFPLQWNSQTLAQLRADLFESKLLITPSSAGFYAMDIDTFDALLAEENWAPLAELGAGSPWTFLGSWQPGASQGAAPSFLLDTQSLVPGGYVILADVHIQNSFSRYFGVGPLTIRP